MSISSKTLPSPRYVSLFFWYDRYLLLQTCRIMIHGCSSTEGEGRIRQNTNSSKWKLQTVTIGMLATTLVLVRAVIPPVILPC